MGVFVGSSIYNAPSIYESGQGGGGGGGGGGGDYERGFSVIKGKSYPIVKIGSYWWTCENLDYKSNNIPLRNINNWSLSSDAQMAYYNDDEATAKSLKIGALYSYQAIVSLRSEDLDGWSVPSKTEWDDLINNSFNDSGAGIISKAQDNLDTNFPSGWNGINYNYMNILPSGILTPIPQNKYELLNEYAYFWLFNTVSNAYRILFDRNARTNYLSLSDDYSGRSLRLCKPA